MSNLSKSTIAYVSAVVPPITYRGANRGHASVLDVATLVVIHARLSSTDCSAPENVETNAVSALCDSALVFVEVDDHETYTAFLRCVDAWVEAREDQKEFEKREARAAAYQDNIIVAKASRTDIDLVGTDQTAVGVSDMGSETLEDIVIDLSVDLGTRIESLSKLYALFGQEGTIEVIKRLTMMYMMSGISTLREYLIAISRSPGTPAYIRYQAAETLCSKTPDDPVGFQALNSIFVDGTIDLATPLRLDAIFLLATHPVHEEDAIRYLIGAVGDYTLECEYRYRIILSCETRNAPQSYQILCSRVFCKDAKNRTLYRILACQYLLGQVSKAVRTSEDLNKKKVVSLGRVTDYDGSERMSVEDVLMGFATDSDLDYNLRADAADALLGLGSPSSKAAARDIIMALGKVDGVVRTVFDNAQNVHVREIEDSVTEAIEFLFTKFTRSKNYVEPTFDTVRSAVLTILQEEADEKGYDHLDGTFTQKVEAVTIAFNRIFMDRALYSRVGCNLNGILCRVWSYVTTHNSDDSRAVMKQRLIEELEEMAGTCSSGFASRLTNVISGFGDFNMRISWTQQVVANFSGRLNAIIREIPNSTDIEVLKKRLKIYAGIDIESVLVPIAATVDQLSDHLSDFQAKVLEEMTLATYNHSARCHFMAVYQHHLSEIRDELYQEFAEHITDTDFDLAFREALTCYETGSR